MSRYEADDSNEVSPYMKPSLIRGSSEEES